MKTLNPITDAFRMHDEQGFPLVACVVAAKARGYGINLAAFACDALKAGWTEKKVQGTLEEAAQDNGVPFDWTEFRHKLMLLWNVAGKLPDPECWSVMKNHSLSMAA